MDYWKYTLKCTTTWNINLIHWFKWSNLPPADSLYVICYIKKIHGISEHKKLHYKIMIKLVPITLTFLFIEKMKVRMARTCLSVDLFSLFSKLTMKIKKKKTTTTNKQKPTEHMYVNEESMWNALVVIFSVCTAAK
jgi:hypothetical protein